MAKQKYYVVWEGKLPGIYDSWAACQKQVSGFQDAKFKSYESKEQAEKAFKEGWKKHWGQGKGGPKTTVKQSALMLSKEEIDYDSISVDVGTRGNPGPVEYKGVDTRTGEILFYVGPIENGTNNLGEFIAIIHALSYLQKIGSSKTVYTDSRTALSWIRNKKVASSLVRNESTKKIWELTDRAVQWLHSNTYNNKILKWNTEEWGEIKADFGRK
ncbi:ribonuclease H [Paenibacillus abyssi]|uniref:Ribonuclease H n=1 Tax=Paenibacillus abyssi TaxID=1340531 RepID=A0A917D3V0_9BACL|nr:ribonuclease H family protein [Paenibacillus abyssi]GGG06266.1 ribonuclease H [Paenibacillus abyssi]